MLPPHLRHRDLYDVIDLTRRKVRPVRPVSQPRELVRQIPRHPPVHGRPVHSQLRGHFHHIRPVQGCPDRVQALLDNRQDNQCQSRPPKPDAPRKRRTRVTETRPLSQINWRRNVARQPPEDTRMQR